MSDILAQALPASELLAGRRAWIISDGVAGHLAITRGVAEVLGLAVEIKTVAPRFPWRQLAPNGPADPSQLRRLAAGALPELVLGAGRQTVPFIRALKRAGKDACSPMIFQSPRAASSSAHLIWVPSHDRLRGPNVITTLTPPHRFTARALAELRARCPGANRRACRARASRCCWADRARAISMTTPPSANSRLSASASARWPAACSSLRPGGRRPRCWPLSRPRQGASRAFSGPARATTPIRIFSPMPMRSSSPPNSVNMAGEACATGRPVLCVRAAGRTGEIPPLSRGAAATMARRGRCRPACCAGWLDLRAAARRRTRSRPKSRRAGAISGRQHAAPEPDLMPSQDLPQHRGMH